ncbi:unnamed protein product [Ectocarpus sp. CCAP 1310/34]|nr:unnamed protein product [Ectocarpus sp. CCAP 1310/34]
MVMLEVLEGLAMLEVLGEKRLDMEKNVTCSSARAESEADTQEAILEAKVERLETLLAEEMRASESAREIWSKRETELGAEISALTSRLVIDRHAWLAKPAVTQDEKGQLLASETVVETMEGEVEDGGSAPPHQKPAEPKKPVPDCEVCRARTDENMPGQRVLRGGESTCGTGQADEAHLREKWARTQKLAELTDRLMAAEQAVAATAGKTPQQQPHEAGGMASRLMTAELALLDTEACLVEVQGELSSERENNDKLKEKANALEEALETCKKGREEAVQQVSKQGEVEIAALKARLRQAEHARAKDEKRWSTRVAGLESEREQASCLAEGLEKILVQEKSAASRKEARLRTLFRRLDFLDSAEQGTVDDDPNPYAYSLPE